MILKKIIDTFNTEQVVKDIAIQFKQYICELSGLEYRNKFWNKTDEEIFEIFKQEKGL